MEHKNVKMFVVAGQEKINKFVEDGLAWLGLDVEINACPLAASEWVEFPFIRDESGSWHGADGIAAFMKKCGKVEI